MSLSRRMTAAAVLTALVASAPGAGAQSLLFGDIDANGDNILSPEELAAHFGPAASEALLSRYDRDGDGFVGRSEMTLPPEAETGMQRAADNRAAAEERRGAGRGVGDALPETAAAEARPEDGRISSPSLPEQAVAGQDRAAENRASAQEKREAASSAGGRPDFATAPSGPPEGGNRGEANGGRGGAGRP